MRIHPTLFASLSIVFVYVSCSDDEPSAVTTSATSASTGGSGGAAGGMGGEGGDEPRSCLGVLSQDGQVGNTHGSYCIACLEDKCCAALVACADDDGCLACADDPYVGDCLTRASVLDLAQCAVDQCEGTACTCITCVCEDDGRCNLPGNERCDCTDCADFEGCHDSCDFDGECDDTDSCACPDCESDCTSCNGDGFCDLYVEACTCSDCATHPSCDLGAGGA